MSRLLTVQDVAERWQQSVVTVQRHVARGDIEVVRIGRSVRITEAAVEAYERAHTDSGRTRPSRVRHTA
jgi:excisionase family DNA binding protein